MIPSLQPLEMTNGVDDCDRRQKAWDDREQHRVPDPDAHHEKESEQRANGSPPGCPSPARTRTLARSPPVKSYRRATRCEGAPGGRVLPKRPPGTLASLPCRHGGPRSRGEDGRPDVPARRDGSPSSRVIRKRPAKEAGGTGETIRDALNPPKRRRRRSQGDDKETRQERRWYLMTHVCQQTGKADSEDARSQPTGTVRGLSMGQSFIATPAGP